MDIYMVVLRLVHIVTAVIWVGSAFFVTAFVQPGAAALGPEGRPFLGYLNQNRNLPRFIAITASLSIAAGALLYWEVSGGLNHNWITSPTGSAFTAGALSAIVAFILGVTVLRPRASVSLKSVRPCRRAKGHRSWRRKPNASERVQRPWVASC